MKSLSEQPQSPEKKIVLVESELETAEGDREEFRIKYDKDGMPKVVAFFDIDGTLAELKFIHGETIKKLFPGKNSDEVAETFFAGFKLGNSFREFDRMLGIYREGYTRWKDPEIYLRERLQQHEREIDEPGNQAHNLAAEYATRYSMAASQVAREIYEREPMRFEQIKIKPIFRLAELYKRLGIPMVGMTANGKDFTKAIAKYSNLSSLFIDIATDETMEGGGKEIAMESLIGELESKGLQIPRDRLVVVGDSLRGDIGSASKLKALDSNIKSQGVLVLEDKDALLDIQKQIETDPDLQRIISNIDTNALIIEEVPISQAGKPLLGSWHRKNFLTKL